MSGFASYIHRIFDHIRNKPEEKPAIAPWVAASLSLAFTLIYVVPFYLSKQTRPSPDLTRDAPSVIKARSRAVLLASVVSGCITVYVLRHNVKLDAREALHSLGWWPWSPVDVLKLLALLVVLFIGPLFEAAIAEGKWRDWIRLRGLGSALWSPMGWRTYVTGPFTEELVFRSLIIPLHVYAKFTPRQLIFLTPLYFGVAHVHHFYEFRVTHPQASLAAAVLRSLVQFGYTSVFGFFAAFVFLRTGSLPAVVAAHTFCNWMGLPRFWGRVEVPVPIGPQDGDALEMQDLEHLDPMNLKRDLLSAGGRLPTWYTVVYYILLVGGAVGFSSLLWTLTKAQQHAILYFETLLVA